MHKIVECVPNFSEGRDPAVIKALCAEIEAVRGVSLLDVDPGEDTHRTVVTFVGPPEAVVEGAVRAGRLAAELIDMTQHHGSHARLGAMDVCPFVPVAGVTMQECAALAREAGRRLGELGIPVYLYEQAAASPQRRDLAVVRAGEYEGLQMKLADPAWKPDFGPATHNPRSGAYIVGAREFLIAYNVNLATKDVQLAKDIAKAVREKDGGFKKVQAMGFFLEDKQQAQVSMNLLDFETTSIRTVYDAVAKMAAAKGVMVAESELIGLAPAAAIDAALAQHIRLPKFDAKQQVVEAKLAAMGG